ncbi:MAG TPA: hypothetical protein V6D02_05610 [Candidatus Obscuribacterales bacterium]
MPLLCHHLLNLTYAHARTRWKTLDNTLLKWEIYFYNVSTFADGAGGDGLIPTRLAI